MIEIIIAIILQITTILGGGDQNKEKVESTEKAKTEKKSSASEAGVGAEGGSGGWSG